MGKAIPMQSDACHKREAQARVVKGIIRDALSSGNHVVVMGDLNDFDPDVPDISGQVPLSAVLRMLKDVDGDGTPDLWNVLEAVPLTERFSSWWDRNHDGAFQEK